MSDSKKVKVLPNIIPDIKFNLEAQDLFANNRGIYFEHWAAIPSTIGMKDRGDYRRPDSLDTISENGFIYEKIGEFKATMVGNSTNFNYDNPVESGIYDSSRSRIIMPRYYSKACDGTKNKEITLLPGDRIYPRDIELKVANYQRVEYNPKSVDYLQFPACEVDFIKGPKGESYIPNKDFMVDKDGNIKWLSGGRNPGIDPDTGFGRIYSIRYKYLAFWYVLELINEIRVTSEDNTKAQRMPYHAVVQREYVYHNKNRGDSINSNKETFTERTTEKPTEQAVNIEDAEVIVDMRNFKE